MSSRFLRAGALLVATVMVAACSSSATSVLPGRASAPTTTQSTGSIKVASSTRSSNSIGWKCGSDDEGENHGTNTLTFACPSAPAQTIVISGHPTLKITNPAIVSVTPNAPAPTPAPTSTPCSSSKSSGGDDGWFGGWFSRNGSGDDRSRSTSTCSQKSSSDDSWSRHSDATARHTLSEDGGGDGESHGSGSSTSTTYTIKPLATGTTTIVFSSGSGDDSERTSTITVIVGTCASPSPSPVPSPKQTPQPSPTPGVIVSPTPLPVYSGSPPPVDALILSPATTTIDCTVGKSTCGTSGVAIGGGTGLSVPGDAITITDAGYTGSFTISSNDRNCYVNGVVGPVVIASTPPATIFTASLSYSGYDTTLLNVGTGIGFVPCALTVTNANGTTTQISVAYKLPFPL